MRSYYKPFLFLAFFSCSENSTSDMPLSQRLVGEWRNVSLRLDMQTYKNTEDSKVFEVSEEEWEAKMRIRPIRTFFRSDGTYNSEHIDLKDSLVYNPAGKWQVVGDTLVMTDTFPKVGASYKYQLVIKGDLAEFSGVEDSDGDGKADDLYFGTQRRQ